MVDDKTKENVNDPEKSFSPTGDEAAAEAEDQGRTITVNEAEYKKLVQEAAEFKDRWVRLFADFENYRKRVERERKELIKYANQDLIIEFLGVMDDLERSVEAAQAKHEDYAAFLKGIEMVMARIYDLLKKNDVKPMETVGKKFDPHCHEILLQMPSAEHEEGIVLEEFQRGYFLGDRVARTAKVKVAVQPPAVGENK